MMQKMKVFFKIFCCVLILKGVCCGMDGINIQLANIQQEQMALQQSLGRLQLQIEALEKEYALLNKKIQQNASDPSLLRDELLQTQNKQKKEILEIVNKQITILAQEMQLAIEKMSVGQKNDKSSKPIQHPKEGISYVVKKGDTLGKIATEYRSTVEYIQSANQIVDPSKDLQVGKTIFIPQK